MAIAWVQHTESPNQIQSGGSTDPFGASTTTGNLQIAVIRSSAPVTITSVTNTAGDTFTLAGSNATHDPSLYIYYKANATGGASQTVTVNWSSGNDAFAYIYAEEVSGAATSGVLDNTWFGTGTGTSDLTVGSIATANAGEFVLACGAQNNFCTYTAGTDFTLIDGSIPTSNSAGGDEYYIPAGTLSSYTAHITSTVTNQYTMAVAAFIAAGGGGGGATTANVSLPLTGAQ